MTSTVTNYKYSFNSGFPVAGADNNSQGFRDNFQAIKYAFTVTSNEISNLQLTTAKLTESNDFAGNSLANATIINPGFPVMSYNGGSTDIDYQQGQFHSIVLDEGNHTINIVNMPGITDAGVDLKSGSMIVSVTTASTAATTIQFVATTGTVVNLGPIDLGANKDFVDAAFPVDQGFIHVFEIWNDSSIDPPNIYIKKLSQNVNGTWTNQYIDSISFRGIYSTFTNIITEDLTIGQNNFTEGVYTGTVGATVVTDGVQWGNLALVPNQITTYITDAAVDSPVDGTATRFGVSSADGIEIGATVSFTNSNRLFVVSTITSATITVTPPFTVGIGLVPVTFTNPIFSHQPTVVTLTTSSTNTNIVGSIYATTNTFQIIFTAATTTTNTTSTTNTFVISNILVNSITTGSGLSISSSTGHVVMTNTGVLSITASTGTTATNTTGDVVIGPARGYNGYGKRWIENTSPSTSVGEDGDIWYKY